MWRNTKWDRQGLINFYWSKMFLNLSKTCHSLLLSCIKNCRQCKFMSRVPRILYMCHSEVETCERDKERRKCRACSMITLETANFTLTCWVNTLIIVISIDRYKNYLKLNREISPLRYGINERHWEVLGVLVDKFDWIFAF